MLEDLEDDTHLCLKCSQTIVGLGNYIQHRKTNCGQHSHDHKVPSETITKTLSSQSVSVNNPYVAFDFNDSTVVDYNVVDVHRHHEKNLRTVENNKSLTEPYGYNYDGADLFFSSLQLQSISKDFQNNPEQTQTNHDHQKKSTGRILTRNATAAIIANHDDWNDNNEKFMKAVNEISGNKKVEQVWMEFNNNYSSDSSGDSDDDEEEDYNAPPRSHTGGKWKPASPLQISTTENLVRWQTVYEASTSGKWKSVDEYQTVDTTDYNQSLWMTPTYKPNEPIIEKSNTEKIWCNICNRNLASKLVYDRHIKTKYHMKRSQTETELDEAPCPMEKLSKRFVKRPGYLNSDIYELEFKKPVRKKLQTNSDKNFLEKSKISKRKRRKIFIKCEICRTKLPSYLLGKHLISHYHYRRMLKNPEISFEIILSNIDKIVKQSPFQCQICRFYTNTETLFIKHWDSIEHINQSITQTNEMFWCSFCKFECKDNIEMRQHLVSIEHLETVLVINRSVPIIIRKKIILSCEICPKKFRFNFELRKHYTNDHQTPILTQTATDQYQNKFHCTHCSEKFHSRISLQKHEIKDHNSKNYYCHVCDLIFINSKLAVKHRSSLNHKITVKKNRNYIKDMKRICNICNITVENLLKLKEHLSESHPEQKYSCTMCGKNFILPQEVSRHVRDKKCEMNIEKNLIIQDLNNFPSEQSLENNTTIYLNNEDKIWKCKLCSYQSTLQSELIFHEIFHSVTNIVKDTKISCPYCEKFFKKQSLRLHLRQHTNERQFQCSVCNATFLRKSSLHDHIKNIHQRKQIDADVEEKNKVKDITKNNSETLFECSICYKKFSKKILREQHLHTHRNEIEINQYKCDYVDCKYSGRSLAELKNHSLIHSKQENFICTYENCNYKGKLKEYLLRHIRKIHKSPKNALQCSHCDMTFKVSAHLKRHLLTHTGEKPFKCPHCDHSCNTIENLRKHVLTTAKHRGRSIYECSHCDNSSPFSTNYLKEYKTHMLKIHNINNATSVVR